MPAVRPVNSVGEFETRPLGTRPSPIDHPLYVGPPAVVTLTGSVASPPVSSAVAAGAFHMVAQVRDGVAMFGTGAVSATGAPVMGGATTSSLAQTTAKQKLQSPGASGIAAQALDLQHLVTA